MSQQIDVDVEYAALHKLLTEVSQHSDALESLAAKMEEAAGVEPTAAASSLPTEDADTSDLDAVARRAQQIIEVTKARGSRASDAAAGLFGKLAEKEVSKMEALKSLRKSEATIASLRAHSTAVETELARLRLASYEDTCKNQEEKRRNEEQIAALVRQQSDLSNTLTDSTNQLSQLSSVSGSLATTLGWVIAAAAAPEELKETARSAASQAARAAAKEMADTDVTFDPADVAAAEEALLAAADAIQTVAAEASSQLYGMKSAGSQEIKKVPKMAAAEKPVAAKPVAEPASEPVVEDPAEQEFDGVVVPAATQKAATQKETAQKETAQKEEEEEIPWLAALFQGIPPSLRSGSRERADRFC